MNQVNFLPDSYLRRRARRNRVARQVLLVAIVAGGLSVWGGLIRGANVMKADTARTLDGQVAAARKMQTEMNRLKTRRAALTHQVKVQRELAQSISHTDVIASLAEMVPPQIALTELQMLTRRPKPTPVVPSGSRRSSRRHSSTTAAATDPIERLEIEFSALAPDPASVANLVEAFSRHPMITQVQMRHTRAIEVRGVLAREFKLMIQVDLNRQFMDPDKVAEVAHAD